MNPSSQGDNRKYDKDTGQVYSDIFMHLAWCECYCEDGDRAVLVLQEWHKNDRIQRGLENDSKD